MIVRKLKRLFYIIKKRRLLKLDTCSYKVRRYGNEYGGFMVYDEILKRKRGAIVYSFGIGEDLSFSEALINTLDIEIFAYDPTPQSIKYVKHHSLYGKHNFHFEEVGLSDKDEVSFFFIKPEGAADVSGSVIPRPKLMKDGIEVKMECINTISKKNGHTIIDLLKIDIEGSEFKVINGMKDWNVLPDQICLEVHDRFFENGIEMLRKTIDCFKLMGYLLIYVSLRGDELTFIRKKYVHE